MYKHPEQFRMYQCKGRGEEDKHEALKRTGKKHIFTGLSNRVVLHSAAEKEKSAYI